VRRILRCWLFGGWSYYAWLGFLFLCMTQRFVAYLGQYNEGLIITNMRDSVSWGFYIGNFTFLVGLAASAVLLVIPAYVYQWKPIKEVVLFGELLAVAAIFMCMLFVIVDMGRPDRLWHIIPFIGRLNFPESLMAWDALVLNAYLGLNLFVVIYLLSKAARGEAYNAKIVFPLVILSIPLAISIHTVTAFLYNGMAARPYWNSAILAPRFLASAFCSGPAVLLVLFQHGELANLLQVTAEVAFGNEYRNLCRHRFFSTGPPPALYPELPSRGAANRSVSLSQAATPLENRQDSMVPLLRTPYLTGIVRYI